MREMTVEEWGNAIFNKIFTVVGVKYEQATTTVYDTLTGKTYNATYNEKTKKLELEEENDE